MFVGGPNDFTRRLDSYSQADMQDIGFACQSQICSRGVGEEGGGKGDEEGGCAVVGSREAGRCGAGGGRVC